MKGQKRRDWEERARVQLLLCLHGSRDGEQMRSDGLLQGEVSSRRVVLFHGPFCKFCRLLGDADQEPV